jgi:hypothetical protein
VECAKFVVDETPYVCWDLQLAEKNREFLEGLDADYFRYVAETNAGKLESEDKHWAALALRVSYSQGLETLFALLCALVQAPECVVGWMLAYKNGGLERLVMKISQGQPVHSRLMVLPSWYAIAQGVHADIDCEPVRKQWIQDGFGKLWERFARDFTNAKILQEYNSVKHGLRTRIGGFHLRVSREVIPGVPPPSEEEWKSLGGSNFGASYFTLEKIGKGSPLNFQPRFHSRNWNPENLVNELGLLSMSIHNVISFLRFINDMPREKCSLRAPDTKEAFDTSWKPLIGVTELSMGTTITSEHIKLCTKEEVLQSYAPAKAEEPSEDETS